MVFIVFYVFFLGWGFPLNTVAAPTGGQSVAKLTKFFHF